MSEIITDAVTTANVSANASTAPSAAASPSDAPVKETPAQRVERVKRERAPWSIMDDIRRYATEGFASISDDDLNVRFRHWGIYTQGDGLGTRGGAVPYFMMRIRTPNGVLTSAQVRTVAHLSRTYARDSVDITNRQNFQLHWLRIEDLPTIWDELARVGLVSMGSCGDNTRTVTGCPLSGVGGDELLDTAPFAQAIDSYFNGNPEFQNLPRKYKVTVCGCSAWCSYPEINDVGLTAVRRGDDVGFSVRVGGGLSTRPHLAIKLNAFIKQEQVLDVVKAITGIFRDSDELRRNRAKARLKFLFIGKKWDATSFLAEIHRRLGYTLEPGVDDHPPVDAYRDHVGIHPQKQPGLHYAGFSVTSGRITPTQLDQWAALADEYGQGRLRLTTMQNIIVLDIPTERIAAFREAAAETGVPLDGSAFQRGVLSCTGSQYCKLAVTETKEFSIRLARQLEARLPGFTSALRVNIAGCPNACGQHFIADIGLQGVQVSAGEGDATTDGFDFFVGGGLGAHAAFSHRLGYRAKAADVPDALQRLLLGYLASRDEGERFHAWSARVGDEHVRAVLSTTL